MEKKTASTRFIVTLPTGLRRVLKTAAGHRGCSQAEVVKAALYGHLKDFLVEDNKREVIEDEMEVKQVVREELPELPRVGIRNGKRFIIRPKNNQTA